MPGKKKDQCPNCGKDINENFCPQCGQANKDYHVSVGVFISKALDDFFSFDSKFLRSILPLLFKPGYLTKQYNSGKRVSYILPLRMYLFASLIFFFILANSKYKSEIYKTSETNPKKSAVVDSTRTTADTVSTGAGADTTHVNFVFPDSADAAPDTVQSDTSKKKEAGLLKKLLTARRDPEKVNATIIESFPKLMFLLLPVFALILKVLYIRSDKFYVEHLIFSFHIHSFIFLLSSVLIVIFEFVISSEDTLRSVGLLSLLVMAVYIYIAMKRVYQQGYLKTMLKYVLLGISYLFVMVISLLAMTMLILTLL